MRKSVMKKGLGSIPKGLAWINSKKEPTKEQVKTKSSSVAIKAVKTSQQGLVEGWTRATFIIKQNHCEKLKALAYWDRKTVKEVIEEALHAYLKNKKVKAIPTKK